MPTNEPLKLCPHCGCGAHTPTTHFNGTPIPRCMNLACLAEARDAKAWNRRTPRPHTAKMVETARLLIEQGTVADWVREDLTAFIAEIEPEKG